MRLEILRIRLLSLQKDWSALNLSSAFSMWGCRNKMPSGDQKQYAFSKVIKR